MIFCTVKTYSFPGSQHSIFGELGFAACALILERIRQWFRCVCNTVKGWDSISRSARSIGTYQVFTHLNMPFTLHLLETNGWKSRTLTKATTHQHSQNMVVEGATRLFEEN
jgi:hypothetical protein